MCGTHPGRSAGGAAAGSDYVVPNLAEVLANVRRLVEAARDSGSTWCIVAYKRDSNAVPKRSLEPLASRLNIYP